MGGWAGVPVGASHGLGYILGGARGAVRRHLLPDAAGGDAVNAPVNGERQRRSPASSAAHEALRGFVAKLGPPVRLAEVGIAAADNSAFAGLWDGGAPIAANPRPVRGVADLGEILRFAASRRVSRRPLPSGHWSHAPHRLVHPPGAEGNTGTGTGSDRLNTPGWADRVGMARAGQPRATPGHAVAEPRLAAARRSAKPAAHQWLRRRNSGGQTPASGARPTRSDARR